MENKLTTLKHSPLLYTIKLIQWAKALTQQIGFSVYCPLPNTLYYQHNNNKKKKTGTEKKTQDIPEHSLDFFFPYYNLGWNFFFFPSEGNETCTD